MNKLKTIPEIVEKIDSLTREEDFFGAMRGDLIDFLPFKEAKKYLKKGVTAKKWAEYQRPLTVESITERVKDYMPFAWEKANNRRGLSAGRSVDHFKAYLWLMNDGSLEEMEKIEYQHYGKEKLIYVAEKFGFDWREVDNNERVNYDYE